MIRYLNIGELSFRRKWEAFDEGVKMQFPMIWEPYEVLIMISYCLVQRLYRRLLQSYGPWILVVQEEWAIVIIAYVYVCIYYKVYVEHWNHTESATEHDFFARL